jgi:hypothetical protein
MNQPTTTITTMELNLLHTHRNHLNGVMGLVLREGAGNLLHQTVVLNNLQDGCAESVVLVEPQSKS